MPPTSDTADADAESMAATWSDVLQIGTEAGEAGSVCHYWRVSAGNGRVLGRSAMSFPDQDAARANCVVVSALAASLLLTVEHARGPGWRWRLDTPRDRGETRTVCTSARTFERQGSCRRAGVRMVHSLTALHTEMQRPTTDPEPPETTGT